LKWKERPCLADEVAFHDSQDRDQSIQTSLILEEGIENVKMREIIIVADIVVQNPRFSSSSQFPHSARHSDLAAHDVFNERF
jgi:hypothetical protein